MSENLDYEDAILRALIRQETFRFNELLAEVQNIKTCTVKTFNKYLKKMVKDGLVKITPESKKEKGKYWIDSGLKTVYISLQYWLDRDLDTLDKLTDTVKSIIDLQDKNNNNISKNEKIKSRLLDNLANQTVAWFHSYRMMMLLVVSGSTAKMNEKMIMRFGESGLRKIKILFDQLKQSDPKMASEFFMEVSGKMIRRETIFNFLPEGFEELFKFRIERSGNHS